MRVLILGGGIHGTGILHDMATRGWQDIHLIEKDTLGQGTSSRSTKLIHGGLRYLRHLRDLGLVGEALRERGLLLDLLPELVKPVELLFPVLKKGGIPRPVVKTGLVLYDLLAGKHRIRPHRLLASHEVRERAPCLDLEKIGAVYSFWDAQTDDLGLVRRVAASAHALGAGITEGVEALRATPTDDGFDVEVRLADGSRRTISALYVVNALGPWADRFLERSQIPPTHRGINNKGVHLLAKDIGLKTGFFLQSPEDRRIFFVLPWEGHTLIGTTEELYGGDPDQLTVRQDEIDYLLTRCNRFLSCELTERDLVAVFAGLRWLAVDSGDSLSDTSRAFVIGERHSRRGMLLTLYGGKLTTYRALSETLGDRITSHFGEFRPSCTARPESWVPASEVPVREASVLLRFEAPSRAAAAP